VRPDEFSGICIQANPAAQRRNGSADFPVSGVVFSRPHKENFSAAGRWRT
jgi:hypothetical protein